MGGYAGHRANFAFVDELSNHTADAFGYAASQRATGWSPPQQVAKKRIVSPLEIICKRCNAAVGAKCTDTNHRKTFERKPHRRRKNDAQLVQEAANAMLKGQLSAT